MPPKNLNLLFFYTAMPVEYIVLSRAVISLDPWLVTVETLSK